MNSKARPELPAISYFETQLGHVQHLKVSRMLAELATFPGKNRMLAMIQAYGHGSTSYVKFNHF